MCTLRQRYQLKQIKQQLQPSPLLIHSVYFTTSSTRVRKPKKSRIPRKKSCGSPLPIKSAANPTTKAHSRNLQNIRKPHAKLVSKRFTLNQTRSNCVKTEEFTPGFAVHVRNAAADGKSSTKAKYVSPQTWSTLGFAVLLNGKDALRHRLQPLHL